MCKYTCTLQPNPTQPPWPFGPLEDMIETAKERGANGMMVVAVSGTAVKLG